MVQAAQTLNTQCCIAGGGPAGLVLGLLLARAGVDVTLLEMHQDFDRDFRGDTVHPSTLEILDQLGLAEGALVLATSRLGTITLQTAAGPLLLADFSGLRTKFPFIAMVPQDRLLDYLAEAASECPNFHLLMGTTVTGLLRQNGAVRGVQYQTVDGAGEITSALVVGADGRFSRVRKLADITPRGTAAPMDVLWFRLPRVASDPQGALARIDGGHMLLLLDRAEQWQLAYVIPKGSYSELRAQGLAALQAEIARMQPELADRVGELQDWRQVSLLSVESSRCDRWYQPGLLLIGDAAHVMSPIAGVGINAAVHDAVVTANTLAEALRAGAVPVRLLARVQRRRELPTRLVQAAQGMAQRLVIRNALDAQQPVQIPWPLRLPAVRRFAAQLLGFGPWPPRVSAELLASGTVRRGRVLRPDRG